MPTPAITNEPSANLIEVFSSIQGEGPLVGLRQIFLRFHGCNLSCEYCDTVSHDPPESALIEATPGRRDFDSVPNPVGLDTITEFLQRWTNGWPAIHHSLSLTGGEPLLNYRLLEEWLPELKRRIPIFLETNGTLYHVLERLIDHLDYISMDIKLPSTSGFTDMWTKHGEFLKIASRKKVFVKMVISDETEDWEISRASELISEVNPEIPCVLQPVTTKDGRIGIAPLKMLEFQEYAARFLSEVRVIPQTHKFLGQL